MGTRLLSVVLMVATVFVIGCKGDPVEEFGKDAIDSFERSQRTADLANLKSIQNAIQIYRTTNGKYPASLDDIAPLFNAAIDFELYDYDPRSGAVTLRE